MGEKHIYFVFIFNISLSFICLLHSSDILMCVCVCECEYVGILSVCTTYIPVGIKFCHFHKWKFVDWLNQSYFDIQSDKVVCAHSVQNITRGHSKSREKKETHK